MIRALLTLSILCFPLFSSCIVQAETPIPKLIGGGNITLRESDYTRNLEILQNLGAGMCRIPVNESIYYPQREAKPLPERLDAVILAAHRHGIEPILLFEYYTRWQGPLGGSEKWQAIGRAFAERFAPGSEWLRAQGIYDWGVRTYSAINEPMWRANNPTPIDPKQYAAALEGLADGVHAVDPSLHVNPGGWQECPLFAGKNPYVAAVAPLFNNGKLDAIGVHRYWDVDYIPMAGRYDYSLQHQFEQVKKAAGINDGVHFYTDEFNFKLREISEEDAACDFLTAIWDALTVVDNEGRPVTRFAMPWNIFHLADRDEYYGLSTSDLRWQPKARGRVLQMVCQLCRDASLISCDPRGSGISILERAGDDSRITRIWVWQNRRNWTNRPGSELKIDNLPNSAKRFRVYSYDGLKQEIAIDGKESIALKDLPTEQTVMFVAE